MSAIRCQYLVTVALASALIISLATTITTNIQPVTALCPWEVGDEGEGGCNSHGTEVKTTAKTRDTTASRLHGADVATIAVPSQWSNQGKL